MVLSRRKYAARKRTKSTSPCESSERSVTSETMRFRPNNAPIVKTLSIPREGFLARHVRKRQENFTANFKISCVGPVPAEQFVKTFFRARREGNGKGKERMPASSNAFREVPVAPRDEKDMYGPLVSLQSRASQTRANCNQVRGVQWETTVPFLPFHRYLMPHRRSQAETRSRSLPR